MKKRSRHDAMLDQKIELIASFIVLEVVKFQDGTYAAPIKQAVAIAWKSSLIYLCPNKKMMRNPVKHAMLAYFFPIEYERIIMIENNMADISNGFNDMLPSLSKRNAISWK